MVKPFSFNFCSLAAEQNSFTASSDARNSLTILSMMNSRTYGISVMVNSVVPVSVGRSPSLVYLSRTEYILKC